MWNSQFSLDAGSDQSVMYWLMLGILLFILSIYGVSVSAGDMLLTLVLRKRSLKYTGDHLFIARTFSSKVRSMSITMGTLSMLVVLTLLSLNVSYLYQGMSGYLLELESPYDIQVFDDPEDREILSDYIALAEEDYTVRSSYLFDVYKDPGMHLQPIISVPGSNTDFDTVISLGTYNELLKLRGLSPVSLEEDGYLILTDRQLIPRFEEAEEDLSTLTLADGTSLRLKGITDNGYWLTLTGLTSFVAVYPDRYVQDLEPAWRQRQQPLPYGRQAAPHPVRPAGGVPGAHHVSVHVLHKPAVQHIPQQQVGIPGVFPGRARHLPAGVSDLLYRHIHRF